jgi:hypothetical protein
VEEVPNVSLTALDGIVWLAPLPPITPRTGIAEIRDGPPGLDGTSARAGLLEGCSGLPGDALRPCDWTFCRS